MLRVLVVDDDESIRYTLSEGLKSMGFDISVACSGNEAQLILDAQSFDVVVTDLYMQDGGGQQLIKWCRENKPEQKLLAISGENLDHVITALDLVEEDGIPSMEKPFKIRELAEVLKGMANNQFF